MSRIMSYADAVRLLGGEGKVVKALDRITGGLALFTAVTGAPAALLDAWLLPLYDPSPKDQREVYELCAAIATAEFQPWDSRIYERYAALLLDRLSTDPTVPPELVASILSKFDTTFPRSVVISLAPWLVRCGLTFLGRDPASDERISAVLRRWIGFVPPALAREAERALDQ